MPPPLFFLHTYQVHSRFTPEKKLADQYFRGEPSNSRYSDFDILQLTQEGKDQYKDSISAEERAEIIKVYDAGIYTFDYRFKEFTDYLKKEGLYDQSLIILFSDHGKAFYDHSGWEHGHSLYNDLPGANARRSASRDARERNKSRKLCPKRTNSRTHPMTLGYSLNG
jgi:arylsulfatase A-like enzyme